MDHEDKRAAEHFRAQIPDYVSGAMPDEHRLQFEAWLIAHPELAEEIELERWLRAGMVAAHRRGWLPRNSKPRYSANWIAAVSVAATLAAVTAGIVLLDERRDRTVVADALAAWHEHETSPHGARVVRLARTRSAGGAPDLQATIEHLPEHLVLQPDVVVLTCADGSIDFDCADGAAPAIPQYPAYDLEIVRRIGGSSVYRSRPAAATNDAPLSFVVHARALEVGEYDLLVRGLSGSREEVVGRFWLQIAANP
jgi:hypothetical protein